jgi:hypothetical protein
MADLHDYFGDIGEDPETVYHAIKKVLLKEGIVVNMIIDSYKSLFLTFSFSKENEENEENKEKEERFHKSLENNKLFNEETKYLLCPECNYYSVKYSTSNYDKNDKKWWCNNCLTPIIYPDYHLDISDKDKYHIYKLWGAEALSIFTNKSLKKTIGFVGSYFKNCCVTKKDKCLYFDFFKEKEKEGKIVEIEGDVISERSEERSEMGIVYRDERGKQSGIVEPSKLERWRSD